MPSENPANPPRDPALLADVVRRGDRLLTAFDAPFADGWETRFNSALSNFRIALSRFKRDEQRRVPTL